MSATSPAALAAFDDFCFASPRGPFSLIPIVTA